MPLPLCTEYSVFYIHIAVHMASGKKALGVWVGGGGGSVLSCMGVRLIKHSCTSQIQVCMH